MFFFVVFLRIRSWSMFVVNAFGGWIQLTAEHNAEPDPAKDPLLLREPAKQVSRFRINSLVYHRQCTRQANAREVQKRRHGIARWIKWIKLVSEWERENKQTNKQNSRSLVLSHTRTFRKLEVQWTKVLQVREVEELTQ